MVNLSALDRLVEQHLSFTASCAQALHDSTLLHPTSDKSAILAMQHLVREHILCGALDKAVSICDHVCPDIIADPQTQLIIRVQKLTELLHRAETITNAETVTDDATKIKNVKNDAIREALCYSQSLAAFALTAFPEAYNEFERAMCLFVEPETVKQLSFILDRRKFVADTLVARLREAKLAHASQLSLLVTYLGLIYIQFHTPIITRDNPPPPLHAKLQQLFNFSLPQDVAAAPIQWRTETLADPRIVETYTSFAERDVQVLPERVGISRQKAIESLRVANGDVNLALKNQLSRVIISNPTLHKLIIDFAAARGLNAFCLVPSPDTQGVRQVVGSSVYVSYHTGEGALIAVPESELSENLRTMWHAMNSIRAAAVSSEHKYESISALRAAAYRAGVLSDDTVKFRLAQREVAILADDGLLEQALNVMRSEMGPIALKIPTLRSELEEISVMVAFTNRELSGDEQRGNKPTDSEATFSGLRSRVWKSCSLKCIVQEIYNVLQRRYEEPDLVMLLRGLLETHAEWQEVGIFTDEYSASFKIGELRKSEDEENGNDHAISTDAVDSTHNDTPRDERDSQLEDTILSLMEILASSRAEAVTLVKSHPRTTSLQVILESALSSRGF